jgi:hypothetical protein
MHTYSLPPYCVPTAAIERRLGLTRLPSPELNRPSPPVPCLSFEQFITTQPEWSRSLLHTLDKDLSYEEIFQLLTCPTSFPSDWCLRWICSILSRNVRMGSCNQRSPPHISSMQRTGIWSLHGFISCRILWTTFNNNLPPPIGSVLQSPDTTNRNLV